MASAAGPAQAPSTPQRASGAVGEAALSVAQRGFLTVGVMAAMVMQVLDTTIANVALPHMQASLNATSDTVTWVLTSYIVAAAIATPITGWLSDRFGSRNLFLFAVSGFIIASMLCGIATSLEEMVAFRLLQGICGAFIPPLSQTVMMDINPPERQAKAMSIWGMGVMVGPIMGPVLGGWLTENYSWRWCFYVNVPIGALTLAILWLLLPSRPRTERRFDGFGFGMIALGVASFQLMLDRGQHEDWFQSWEILIEGGIAIAALWVAVVHLATAKRPLFERALFRDRNLVAGMFFMLLIGAITLAPLALLPPMLQHLYGYSVIYTGMVLAPRGAGVLITMFISSQFAGKIDLRFVIATGMLIISYSLWEMAQWSLDVGPASIVTTGFLQGLGMGLVFMQLNTLAFATLDRRWRTDGTSLMNLLRSLGASAGISLCTTLLTQNTQTTHEHLTRFVTRSALDVIDPAQATRYGEIGGAALAAVNAELTRQATMIAYLNDFYMLAIVTLVCTPLVFVLRNPRGPVEQVHLGE
ncbi:EmrB/QacA family drug resistance transporter [Tardibacter chloracetimidivorans]|uniref:EmrB/QacA family drug resistance transporter n=1 Tax=Tardibacter chloracetimidivorans TaxID=1921510 RepID=A0A1L3ZW59_9SPHN|nr:DHA2 family efflux MFS transporter permease subunit [Tardibacter chloracetimidivorans]API59872.1 EmrB/QacA family drug resistance transporter [Tardibacter chloracetimidivorans]